MSTDTPKTSDEHPPVGHIPDAIEAECDGCGEVGFLDEFGIAGDRIAYIHTMCNHISYFDITTVMEDHTDR